MTDLERFERACELSGTTADEYLALIQKVGQWMHVLEEREETEITFEKIEKKEVIHGL